MSRQAASNPSRSVNAAKNALIISHTRLLHQPCPTPADLHELSSAIATVLNVIQEINATAALRAEALIDCHELIDRKNVDPVVRISTCVESLNELNGHLHSALLQGMRFQTAIGYLGVIPSDQPEHRTATTGELGATFDAP